jgi:hypothetical protein
MVADTTPQIGYGFAATWNGHDIGKILNINGPSPKVDTVDITNNDSADAHKEFVAAFVDGGEISIEVREIPGDTTGQKYFLTDLQARTLGALVITYPDAVSKWTISAIATGWDPARPFDGVMNATMSMKVTGKPAFTNS